MTSKAWVMSATEDVDADTVDLELIVPPSPMYMLAPAAMVDWTEANGGYDNGGPHYLYLRDHAFSQDDDDEDIDSLSENDYIRVVEADPDSSSSPLTWTAQILAIDTVNARIEIDTDLSGTWNAAKRYIVTHDDYSTCGASQRSPYCYVADDADRQVQDAVSEMPWGGGIPDGDTSGPYTTEGYLRPYNTAFADGEPLSSSLVWAYASGYNNLAGRVCSQEPVGFGVRSAVSTAAAAYAWLAGPFPFHHPPGATTLTLKAHIRATGGGTASFRFTISPSLPGGAGTTLSWSGNVVQGTEDTTEAGGEEVTVSLALWPTSDGNLYLTVEGMTDGGTSANLYSLTGYFDTIPV